MIIPPLQLTQQTLPQVPITNRIPCSCLPAPLDPSLDPTCCSLHHILGISRDYQFVEPFSGPAAESEGCNYGPQFSSLTCVRMSSAAGSFDFERDLEVIEFAFRKVHGRPVDNTTTSSGLATASSGDGSAVFHTGAIGVDEELAGIVSSNEAMNLRHTVDLDARWEKGLWCIVRIGRIELGRKDTSCTDSAIIVVAACGHDWVYDHHEGTHCSQILKISHSHRRCLLLGRGGELSSFREEEVSEGRWM